MKFDNGHPLVSDLIWEVDRAVKQAATNNGQYDTCIRHILNKHLSVAPTSAVPSPDAKGEA